MKKAVMDLRGWHRAGTKQSWNSLDDRGKWAAVRTRERRADGAFVYAVRSTGIYCRPSCPARKPSRRGVLFFRSPETAEQRGFRACRRCRPDEPLPRDPQIKVVARICQNIEDEIANSAGEASRLSLRTLADAAGMNEHKLLRAFRRVVGLTPRQYADGRRTHLLKSRLKKDASVTAATYAAGYGSSSRLYERAASHLGMTPATYRKGGKGMRIRYTIVGSPLGRMLVGATERGICALYLGDSNARLEAALEKEYPRSEITRDPSQLQSWTERIVGHLAGKEPSLDLPTDVQATAFQRRVWEELRRIPFGDTRTYAQVARAIGRPTAVRAVARACATNPVSVIVPCHRVVREDGELAGYRWGLDRKRMLLEHEKSATRKQKGSGD